MIVEEKKLCVELSAFEIDIICSLLSGRISQDYYVWYHSLSPSVSSTTKSIESLRRRLGLLIGVEYV